MAGVGDYDPERPNETPWVDDNLDNDDHEETTTSLPPENSFLTSILYDASDFLEGIDERLKRLRDELGSIEIPPASKVNILDPEDVKTWVDKAKKVFTRPLSRHRF